MSDKIRELSKIDYRAIHTLIQDADNLEDRLHVIVNAPFEYKVATAFLFLGIVVLLQVSDDGRYIDRVALSSTELAKNTTDVSFVPFNQIRIPVDHPENIISTAIRTGLPQDTTDWKFLFEPAMTPDQARMNQASGGIAYSAVYPLPKSKKGGALIFSYFQYQQNIGEEQKQFMSEYSRLVDDALNV